MREITVIGGGPAGGAAAVAARLEGAGVHLYERTRSQRHKVCGEFLSPAALTILESLQINLPNAHRIDRCVLHLGRRAKSWRLPEPATGFSRLRLDALLLDRAAGLGAYIHRGETAPKGDIAVLACGRAGAPSATDRLFGFKAHFTGPQNDAVELYFDTFGYAGVSGVEDGFTNVCGIASESTLQRYGFDFDALVRACPALADRVAPLRRAMEWLAVGPLAFRGPTQPPEPGIYPAGDALGFVDPFTGSGILNALWSGRQAGLSAARGISTSAYFEACRAALERPYRVSSVLRYLARRRELHPLLPLVPGAVLFDWTRLSA
jgi:flavin-dependent dehydrogenase